MDHPERDDKLLDLIIEAIQHLEMAEQAEPGEYIDLEDEESESLRVPVRESFYRLAVSKFEKALESMPQAPWLWFQIGWCHLSFGESPQQIEQARAAFEKVVEAEPDNPAANIALAALILKHGPFALGQDLDAAEELSVGDAVARWLAGDQEDPGLAWADLPGQHLRAALDSESLAVVLRREWPCIVGTNVEVQYLATDASFERFLERLWRLGKIVPLDRRAWYYFLVGSHLDMADLPAAVQWYEEAIQWEDARDPEDLMRAHLYLGWCYAHREPPDYLAACKQITASYEFLLKMPDPRQQFEEWLPYPWWPEGWDPGPDLEGVLDMIRRALNLSAFGEEWPDFMPGDLAALAEAGGRLLLNQGKSSEAIHYLEKARLLDKDRVSTGRLLAHAYLDVLDWAKALAEFKRVHDLAPQDREARRLWTVLRVAEASANNSEIIAILRQEIDEIREGQRQIIGELALQRDLLHRVVEAQNRLPALLRQYRNDEERATDALMDQLHQLILEGSSIQPAAYQAAYEHLLAELGEDVFDGLVHDSRHFLCTAEVFFKASAGVGQHIDAGLIAVEYAKAVETQLRRDFLPQLGCFLDRHNRSRELWVSVHKQVSRGSSWSKTLGKLSLGETGGLLQQARSNADNQMVLQCVEGLGFTPEWLRQLADNIHQINQQYRNGAAHTEALSRADLEALRELLIAKGLLCRLVELCRKAESQERQDN